MANETAQTLDNARREFTDLLLGHLEEGVGNTPAGRPWDRRTLATALEKAKCNITTDMVGRWFAKLDKGGARSEEHTSELQSL